MDDGPWKNARDGTHVTVKPGARTITFRSGSVTKSIDIEAKAGVADGRKCYFQGSVNVTAGKSKTWGYIVIDGVQREETPPKEIPLPPGRHTVTIKKAGYTPSPVERVVIIAPSLIKPTPLPASFDLNKNKR